ncbi:Acetyltransferase (GNAT) domain-containing protein [Granulicella pectinivorans]|jgi:hypothetical protein|uniref:Acetyltransferase (GNAT) domain-containing protein n=1 Tax=Granulicella pectinivorans TaxID=474950 RepID=A0A1I6LZP9_9BACT|nr:Acetyltransferase (GNAT) domain-containing protein [Granulicella pectinivorans]
MSKKTISSRMEGRLWRKPGDFVAAWQQIQTLRQQLHVEDDVLLNPLHFLTAIDDTRRSCSIACWRGPRLIGVVFATEHYIRSIGTGYAIAGDFAGRGAILCRPQDESEVLKCAIETMTSHGIHSLHLRLLPTDQRQVRIPQLKIECMEALTPGDRMLLPPTFDAFLATLGKHTRRNVRYYSRKAQAEGIEFVSCLTQQQFDDAVVRLNAATDFPAEPLRLTRDARLMQLHDGCQRFGLRTADGTFIAILSGFTQGNRFHVLTQLNDASYEHLSLSLVLRGYTVEHLIGSGHTSLQFMGGTSLSFGRFCIPQFYRSLFIDRPRGLFAIAKSALATFILHRERAGKHIPESIRILAGSYLPQETLAARTAIAPAAVAFARDNAPTTDSNPYEPVIAIRSQAPQDHLDRAGIVQDRRAKRQSNAMRRGDVIETNLRHGRLQRPRQVLNVPHRKASSA